MRVETVVNKMPGAKSSVDSLFACAKISGMRSDEITAAFHAILSDYSGFPRWAKEYLRGRFDSHWDRLYQESLAFGGFYQGKFYTTHSNRADYYAKHGIEPAQWAENCHSGLIQTGHYWMTTKEPKPFFV